jgi:hypothetical protein
VESQCLIFEVSNERQSVVSSIAMFDPFVTQEGRRVAGTSLFRKLTATATQESRTMTRIRDLEDIVGASGKALLRGNLHSALAYFDTGLSSE